MKQLIIYLTVALLCSHSYAQLASPNDDGLTFGHVHLNVTDVEAHAAIWTEHFDGEVITDTALSAIRFPNMVLILREQEPTMGSRETVMDHFGFKVRDIQKFIDRWEGAGFEMGRVFTGAEGQTNAYVTLPGGVYVELQEDQGLHEEITGYHVHYFTAGHAELLDWYTEHFNLEIRPRGSIGSTTNVPGMNLSFGNSDSPRAPTAGTAIDHIGFEVENLEAFCEKLAAQGISFDRPYTYIESLDLGVAFLTDPKGVVIELTEGLVNF